MTNPVFKTFLLSLVTAGTLVGVAGSHGVAWAQPTDEIAPDDPEMKPPPTNDPRERAKEFYNRGRKNYDLGKFRRAVALFTRAYEEFSDGAFLFNIAQSYRQLDDCKQALFFYKRFLSVKKDIPAGTKKEVDGHIAVLEQCVKNQEDIRRRPPDGTAPPDGVGPDVGGGDTGSGDTGSGNTGGGDTAGGDTGGGNTGGGDTGDGRVADSGGGDTGGGDTGDGDGDDGDTGEEPGTAAAPPHLIALFARGGGAKIGAGDLNVPLQAAVNITAGYPLAVGDKLKLDVGAGFGYSPVPYANGTGSLTTLAAHAGATFEVAPKIGVRGELDLGVMLFGGLVMGNPFTVGGQEPSAALTMFNVRAGLSGEYAITNNVSAIVTPIAFAYSPGDSKSLAPGLDAITRIEFLAGLGYRM